MSDMGTLMQAKQLINTVIDAEYDTALQAGLAGADRGTFATEFQAMALYVSGADNNISSEEIDLMNFLFDLSLTPNNMSSLISTLSGLHDDFMVRLELPGWALFKSVDEFMGNHDATDMYISAAEMVMNLFSAIDGNTDAKEERYINGFLNRLRRDR